MPASYLLIVSADPLEYPAARHAGDLASQLKRRGHEVTVFLLQNGVLSARAGAAEGALVPLSTTIEMLADEFSLRERGIELDELRSGITVSSIDIIVQRLAAGWKVLWS